MTKTPGSRVFEPGEDVFWGVLIKWNWGRAKNIYQFCLIPAKVEVRETDLGSRGRERRNSERINVLEIKAFCQSQQGADWYEVGNISETGVFLKNGFLLPLKTKVTIDCMRLEGRRGRMVGEVVRNDEGMGIRFDLVNENSTAFIEDIKSKEILNRSGPVALALVKNKYAINWFDSINSDASIFVVRVDKFEDAKSKINDPWIPLSTVILDSSDAGRELARFIKLEKPELNTFLVTRNLLDNAEQHLVDSSDVWIELKSPDYKSSIVKKMSFDANVSTAKRAKTPLRRRRDANDSTALKSRS